MTCGHQECNGVCRAVDPDVWTSALDTASEILASVERRKRLVARLVEGVAAGIQVLEVRDGMSISRDQVMDRARNITTWLINDFSIQDKGE